MSRLEQAWGATICKQAVRAKMPRDYKRWLRSVMGDFGKKHPEMDGYKGSTAEVRKGPGWTYKLTGAARDRKAVRDARRLLTKYMERVKGKRKDMSFDIRQDERRGDVTFTMGLTFS